MNINRDDELQMEALRKERCKIIDKIYKKMLRTEKQLSKYASRYFNDKVKIQYVDYFTYSSNQKDVNPVERKLWDRTYKKMIKLENELLQYANLYFCDKIVIGYMVNDLLIVNDKDNLYVFGEGYRFEK